MPPHTRTPLRRVTSAVAAVALGVAGCALAAGALAPAAGAASNANDPTGGSLTFTAAKAPATGLVATGWTTDADSPSTSLTLYALLDGTTTLARGVTSVPNAAVRAKYHTGPTPGFSLPVPVPTGRHTVCIVARNVGPGTSAVLGCTATPLGTHLTSAQLAAHSPKGSITGYSADASSLRFRGWASDPDWYGRRLLTVLYVDGAPATTSYTTAYPAPRPAQAGSSAAFDITVPVSTGSHIGCIWVVDVGFGDNSFLGCHAVDTRGKAGTGALPAPAVNKAVVTEALKHKGQSYVWGAVGPKVFDCSGLVVYSYGKAAKGLTIPRVSEAQALSARLIPASRAVPGDLVFTHDSEGDVYHVGIYVKPGQAFAAIDEDEGVNYQNIWDPSSTTYGSFTHT